MRKHQPRLAIAGALLLAAGVFACSSSDGLTPSASNSGTGSSGSGSSSGTLTIHLTDSPFSDAKALLVTFSDVSVHQADPGEWKTLPFASGSSRTCDLKKLNGATDVLGVGSLPAGKYTQVRLNVRARRSTSTLRRWAVRARPRSRPRLEPARPSTFHPAR